MFALKPLVVASRAAADAGRGLSIMLDVASWVASVISRLIGDVFPAATGFADVYRLAYCRAVYGHYVSY